MTKAEEYLSNKGINVKYAKGIDLLISPRITLPDIMESYHQERMKEELIEFTKGHFDMDDLFHIEEDVDDYLKTKEQ